MHKSLFRFWHYPPKVPARHLNRCIGAGVVHLEGVSTNRVKPATLALFKNGSTVSISDANAKAVDRSRDAGYFYSVTN